MIGGILGGLFSRRAVEQQRIADLLQKVAALAPTLARAVDWKGELRPETNPIRSSPLTAAMAWPSPQSSCSAWRPLRRAKGAAAFELLQGPVLNGGR